MSAFDGKDLIATWIQSAATTILTGDHKSVSLTPNLDLYDQTAGADTNKSYLVGVIDHTATFNANLQSGSVSGGTATFSTLSTGNIGTLRIQPEGTASTKPKIELPAISQGVGYSWPYDNVCEVTVNFQGNGALSESANS